MKVYMFIVLPDRSKLGQNSLSTIAHLAPAGLLITDTGTPEKIAQELRQNIEVMLV